MGTSGFQITGDKYIDQVLTIVVKTQIKVLSILAMLLLTSVSTGISAQENIGLKKIKAILENSYPDHLLITKAEFDEKFLRDHGSIGNEDYLRKLPGFPTVAYGDFNHDNKKDFAAILRGKVRHPPQGMGYYYYDRLIVVCHVQSKSKYVCQIAEDKGKAILPFQWFLSALTTEKASSEHTTDCKKLIPPKKDFFALVPIVGRASYPYYYVKGKYTLCHD